MKLFVVFLFIYSMPGSTICLAGAGNITDPVISETAQTTIQAIRAGMSLLARGEYSAAGFHVVIKGKEEISRTPTEMKCVFDVAAKSYRWECRESIVVGIGPASELTPEVHQEVREKKFRPSKGRRRPLVAYMARTPGYVVNWFSMGEQSEPDHAVVNVEIQDPATVIKTPGFHPFSSSSCGLMGWSEFEIGLDGESILSRFLSDASVVDSLVKDNGNIELVFTGDRKQRVIEVGVDTGFRPISMNLYYLDKNGDRLGQAVEHTVAHWEERDAAWIPTHIEVSRFIPSQHTYSYDIHWDSCNGAPSDPAQFTYNTFEGVWKGLYVYDRRGGVTRHIDTIGQPFSEIFSDLPVAGVRNPPSKMQAWLLFINGLVGLFLVLWFVRRKRKSRA